ncbi:uncharacterized protein LOC143265178 isoform X2 [Megachile rotundata]|uniref:uncharacterized protein LOC143265178 isoform X2 n=1 Tax=Megachile rotundata TaxID=143995 RepID=UPI003FD4AE49
MDDPVQRSGVHGRQSTSYTCIRLCTVNDKYRRFTIAGIRIVTILHRRRANHQSTRGCRPVLQFFVPFLLCELVAFPAGRAFHVAVFHLHATTFVLPDLTELHM